MVTDNIGVAFVLNSISYRYPLSLVLLRPFAGALAKYRLGLVTGHAHRHHKTHADELSYVLPQELWDKLRSHAVRAKPSRVFVVHEPEQHEAFAVSMSFPQASTAGE